TAMAPETSRFTCARRSGIQHLCAPRRCRNRELYRVDLHGPACRVRVYCRQPVRSGCLGALCVHHAITVVTELEAFPLSDSCSPPSPTARLLRRPRCGDTPRLRVPFLRPPNHTKVEVRPSEMLHVSSH